MSTLRDPPRLRHGAGGGGDDPLASALDAAHARLPDAQRMDAMERALLAKISPPPSPGGGGDGGGGGGGAASTGTLALRWGAGVAAAAGAAAVIGWAAHRAESRKNEIAPPSVTALATASVAPPIEVPSGSSNDEGGLPTVSVESLPPAPPAPSGPRSPPPAAPSTPSDSSETELAFLQRAQDALASHPDQTLALCAEHPRRFPHGVLGEEREVLAIDALVRLGQRGAAEERAQRFFAAYPTSAHKRRIEQLLGAD